MSRGLWTMWTTWTAWTRMIGASDLRMNLLVGDEVTHYTNVPCVEEVSEGDSLLQCLSEDCGKCDHCRDIKRFGGPGKLKQARK